MTVRAVDEQWSVGAPVWVRLSLRRVPGVLARSTELNCWIVSIPEMPGMTREFQTTEGVIRHESELVRRET